MLRRLTLRDFVIVDQLELDIGPGLTVLTGETGAGKSILIDALQLVLGQRGDSAVVREGCERADIGAEFDAPAHLGAWLDEAGFDDNDGLLLLRRTVDAKGKSRAWINGSPATLTQLGDLAQHLVDIHGQHAWQSLTRPEAVRAWLDGHAGVDTAALQQAWRAWRQAQQTLATAQAGLDQQQQERERLQWQLQEADRLAPGAHEWADLNAEHARLAHASQLQDAAREAVMLLDDGQPAALDLLHRAAAALEAAQAHDARLGEWAAELSGAAVQAREVLRALQHYGSEADLDPQRLQQLDERLTQWMSLARRYRCPPEELPALQQRWRDALADLDRLGDVAALQQAVDQAWKQLQKLAKAASTRRQAVAPRLAERVSTLMQALGMAGGRLEVALLPQPEMQAYGLEGIELRVAGHAGTTPRPLAKVASGGELSRLALAVAVTGITGLDADLDQGLAAVAGSARATPGDQAPTVLIFDEIDAGIGGAVADTVGRMMHALGARVQVLAVTHLAQVAAYAHQHARVSKDTVGGPSGTATVSRLTLLDAPGRVHEIARLLGGQISPESLAHARTLLAQAGAPVETPSTSSPRNR
ncbi:DNA repair protein RecN [Amphibiibacter pelophylacis]|uniref:DNA repair protein RecN n=1 Tax=Amphibiibacter pelophylacis TaxID=1799477 RepID=A0ACC6P3W5_9BURK